MGKRPLDPHWHFLPLMEETHLRSRHDFWPVPDEPFRLALGLTVADDVTAVGNQTLRVPPCGPVNEDPHFLAVHNLGLAA